MFPIPARSCSSLPPVVRMATPVEGRFERLILSCSTTSDHHVLHYQVFAEQALQVRPPPGVILRRSSLCEKHVKTRSLAEITWANLIKSIRSL